MHRTCRPLPVIIVTGVGGALTTHSAAQSGCRLTSTGSTPSRQNGVAAGAGFCACAAGLDAGCACANAQAKNKNKKINFRM
jgi:hypothetical protein